MQKNKKRQWGDLPHRSFFYWNLMILDITEGGRKIWIEV